jgi:hypothetical protein
VDELLPERGDVEPDRTSEQRVQVLERDRSGVAKLEDREGVEGPRAPA